MAAATRHVNRVEQTTKPVADRDIVGNGVIDGVAVCQTVVCRVIQALTALEVRLEHGFQSFGSQQLALQDTEVDLEELGDVCVNATTSNIVDDRLRPPEISDFVKFLVVSTISFPHLHLSCQDVWSFIEMEGDIASSNRFEHVLPHVFAEFQSSHMLDLVVVSSAMFIGSKLLGFRALQSLTISPAHSSPGPYSHCSPGSNTRNVWNDSR